MPTNEIVAATRPCIPSGVTDCRTPMTVTFTNWPPIQNRNETATSAETVTAEEPCSTGTHRNTPPPSAAARMSTRLYPNLLGSRAASSEPTTAQSSEAAEEAMPPAGPRDVRRQLARPVVVALQ